MKKLYILPLVLAVCNMQSIYCQTSTLIAPEIFQAIIDETSGELGLQHFTHIVTNYSGFSPSLEADQP